MGRIFGVIDAVHLAPRAQVSWGQVEGGSFEIPLGLPVLFEDSASLTGRIGLAPEFDWSALSASLEGNVRRELSGSRDIEVDGRDFADESEDFVEAAFGLSRAMSDGAAAFLKGSYSASADSGEVTRSHSIDLGMTWNW